jgi:hypothetical protein
MKELNSFGRCNLTVIRQFFYMLDDYFITLASWLFSCLHSYSVASSGVTAAHFLTSLHLPVIDATNPLRPTLVVIPDEDLLVSARMASLMFYLGLLLLLFLMFEWFRAFRDFDDYSDPENSIRLLEARIAKLSAQGSAKS